MSCTSLLCIGTTAADHVREFVLQHDVALKEHKVVLLFCYDAIRSGSEHNNISMYTLSVRHVQNRFDSLSGSLRLFKRLQPLHPCHQKPISPRVKHAHEESVIPIVKNTPHAGQHGFDLAQNTQHKWGTASLITHRNNAP
jgi:hypothetical protein